MFPTKSIKSAAMHFMSEVVHRRREKKQDSGGHGEARPRTETYDYVRRTGRSFGPIYRKSRWLGESQSHCGYSLPAHSRAAGKALLAGLSEAEVMRRLKSITGDSSNKPVFR